MRAIVSEAGLGAADNDDCAGFAQTAAGLYAWVIDGATSVAERDYLGAGPSDVAWYSNALSARLQANAAKGLALRDLHDAAASEVAVLYREFRERLPAPPPLYAQPLAALTMVRLSDAGGELYQLGDCPAFVLQTGGVRRLTIGEPSDATAEARAQVAATLAAVDHDVKAVWAEWLPSIRESRKRQVARRPLEVSTPVAGAAFGGYSARLRLAEIEALVLMSDGFERFATAYELGDAAAMVRRAVEAGPGPLLAALRAVEQADPDCRRFPRLKPSDDATCLVIVL